MVVSQRNCDTETMIHKKTIRTAFVFLVVIGVFVLLFLKTKKKIPVQYSISDVRGFHIYNKHLLKKSRSIHLRPANHSVKKDNISVVQEFDADLPIIYVVTPTYTRCVQRAELTNMCTVMKHVRNIVWIVIEDSLNKTQNVKDFLRDCEIPAVHINFKSYFEPELTVDQRNAALDWIKENVNVTDGKGVVYFADDDNTYDPRIFEEMRYTKKVSVWPVGLASGISAEMPVAEKNKIVDWISGFDVKERKFPIDMAGFAFNVKLLDTVAQPQFRHDIKSGYMETSFIDALGVTQNDLEPKADGCTKIYVWHTQTVGFKSEGQPSTKTGQSVSVPEGITC